MNQFGDRQINPINAFWKYTGKLYPMGKAQVTTDKNCRVVIDYIKDYVERRKKENKENPKN